MDSALSLGTLLKNELVELVPADEENVDFLLNLPRTNSVFAYTLAANMAERRALEKAGFIEKGILPSVYYDIGRLPPEPSVLYVKFQL